MYRQTWMTHIHKNSIANEQRHIYPSLSIHLYLSMHIYPSLSIHAYLYMHIYLSMPIHIHYTYVSICLPIHLYLSISLYLCLSIHVYLSIPMYQCLSIHFYVSLSIYLSLSIHLPKLWIIWNDYRCRICLLIKSKINWNVVNIINWIHKQLIPLKFSKSSITFLFKESFKIRFEHKINQGKNKCIISFLFPWTLFCLYNVSIHRIFF